MKKRLLSLLLCLSFVLALVPTAAMAVDGAAAAGDTLTPADLCYNFNGSVATEPGESNITLSKTATTTDGKTFNVTLTAKAQENVKIVAPEVTFVLDASRSMESQNGTSTRWDVAKSAVATMDTNLGKDVSKNYVYFNSGAGTATDSSYSGVKTSAGTNLVAGVAEGMTAFHATGSKKVLIIVSDGEANNGEPSITPNPECYPTKLIDEFKKAGGVVYTVGFSFEGDSAMFMALASDESCQFLANNAQELNVAMGKIATKINGLIIDPMGENVELVSNVTVNEAYKDSSLNVVDNTIYWNNADGLAEPVTLTYQVKIKQTVLDQVETADEGLDVYLNGNATLNYTYGGSNIAVAFPKPYVRLDPEPKMYTLTYVTNKGTEIAPETYTEGTKVDLTKKTTTLDGYTFKGWYSDEALTTKVDEVTMDKDQTVYAKWDQIYYTLKYETNGGTAVESKSVAANAATDVDGKTTKDGYKFLGWYSDKELTKPITKIEKMTGDVTVYAKWQEITYTLTYVSNGGTEFDAETYPEGKEVDLDKIPTKSGFTFTGWFADAALTQLLTKVTMDANKTVYAGWKEDETPVLEKGDHSAYIIGYKDGTVQPDREISRAEVATIFFRLLTDEAREKYWSSTNEYTDVKDSDWCNNAISTLSNMGIIKGYPDGSFKPNAKITRAEFAVIATRFSKSQVDEDASFTDVSKDFWASKEIAKAANLGWIKGYPDGTFRPENKITRGEVMTLVNRVLERGVDEEGLGEYAKEWKDVQPGSYWYYAVQEATNSHEYARTDKPIDGQSYCYEEWTKTKENRDWAALEKIWKNKYEAN